YRLAARIPGPQLAGRAAAGGRSASAGRARREGSRSAPGRAVGRRAAAGGDRAGPRDRAPAAPGRRADREPRLAHGAGRPRSPAGAERGGGAHDRSGNPQQLCRGLRPSDRGDARRAHRGRTGTATVRVNTMETYEETGVRGDVASAEEWLHAELTAQADIERSTRSEPAGVASGDI